MLIQTITAAEPHPHLAQAIDAAAPMVDELRHQVSLSARAKGEGARIAVKAYIETLTTDIAAVAARVDLTGEQLTEEVVARASAKARRGRPIPTIDTSRTLLDHLTKTVSAAADARRAVSAAQRHLAATMEDLRLAEDACKAHGVKL